MPSQKTRRQFLVKSASLAGLSLIPSVGAAVNAKDNSPVTIDFLTHLPREMTLAEYRSSKEDFEDKKRVDLLIVSFKKSGKMKSEEFSFHGTHSQWRVVFRNEEAYREWMSLTEDLELYQDSNKEQAGVRLEIRRHV